MKNETYVSVHACDFCNLSAFWKGSCPVTQSIKQKKKINWVSNYGTYQNEMNECYQGL